MIAISNAHVTFKRGTPLETRALRGLSLEIPDAQFVTVIGSNGAGKSTLLNLIAGTVTVDAGTAGGGIAIDGVDVTDQAAAERARLVSRVFQDPLAGTCEELTVEENLALAAARTRRRGLGRALSRDLREKFRHELAQIGLGLENRLGDQIGLLSGGQRQAVSLVMASIAETHTLLLDEHSAALDPKTAELVLDLTRRIVTGRKLTAVMVTHSMRQALDFGDRTVMLHKGKVALDVSGEKRVGLDVPDLLALFGRVQGEEISDDALLLG
ncbi:MAG: ABC transporter ATP-binding protein [Candidatus Eiseniibacteriota bacterium]